MGTDWEELQKENPLVCEVLADDTQEGHEKRLNRYAQAKARQQLIVDHIIVRNAEGDKPPLIRELKALTECGSFLIFRYYLQPSIYRLIGGCTCKKHLLCALCAIRRAAKCIAVYSEKLDHVLQSGEYEAVFITLTIKNGEDLTERFEHLQGSVKALLHKRRNSLAKRPKTYTVFKEVVGAVYSYEVTYKAETGFHPHLHMIGLVPKGRFQYTEKTIKKKAVQVPEELWSGLVKDWQEITGDSFIVDVRSVDNRDGFLAALVETFKYALKLNDMDPEVQVECYERLKARRLLGSLGLLFGVKLPDDLNDELLPEDLEWIDIVYQYSGVTFGYQEISRGNVNLPANFNEQVVKGRLFRDVPFNDHGSDLMLDYNEKGRFGLQRKVLPDAPF